MEHSPKQQQILNAIIVGYRQIIENRYQYDALKKKYDLPAFFNEERIALFRNYFLEYIYPPPTKREELNEAFEKLDDYIKSPRKLLNILLDSGSLIFKYGRHLPKILSTGLKALHSFRVANQFEQKLVQQAIAKNIAAPYNQEKIYNMIKSLPKREIEDFINSSQTLFETLYDRKLVRKIIEIVEFLIAKMKQKPNIYSPVEVKGLEIGRDIIVHGDMLFDELPKEGQQQLFDLVINLERDVIENLFKKME